MPPCVSIGASVPSKDPADLGFAEIDVSVCQRFEFRWSVFVDLSIAVSGFQGSPRWSGAAAPSLRGD